MRPLLAALDVFGDVEVSVPGLGTLPQQISGLHPIAVPAFGSRALLELKVAFLCDVPFDFNALRQRKLHGFALGRDANLDVIGVVGIDFI